MSESSRLGKARGRMLPVAIVAAALVAMLALAPLASAAPSPIASGNTTLTINKGFTKKLKKLGIKVTALKPAKLKGAKASFTVTGGEIEPTTGAGTITHSGGLKVKWGKKSVALKGIEISTAKKTLTAKVGGKKVKLAKLAGVSSARLGFGNSVAAKKVKLTGAGAQALNKKLTPQPTKTKVKKNGKTVVKVVKVKPAFKANMVVGKTTTEVEPQTVNVLATGTMVYGGDPTLFAKLADVGVKVEAIPPTSVTGTTYTSGISGGTISPLGTSGQVNSAGGIKLVQVLPTSATTSISTSITLGSIGVDLAAKTASVEVIGESNAESEGKKPLNLGNLGRSSIADLTITGDTPSPATRSVSVTATSVIQPVAAEVLEGFVKVYEGWYTGVAAQQIKKENEEGKINPPLTSEAQIIEAAKKVAAAKVANDHIKAGEPLGSFSFTATGE